MTRPTSLTRGTGVSPAAAVPALLWVSPTVFPIACASLLYVVRADEGIAAQPAAVAA